MMEASDQQNHSTEMVPDEVPLSQDPNLLDAVIVVAKHRKAILYLTLGAFLIASIVAFLLPDVYVGRVVLMPPQQQQSTAAMMLGQLGTISGLAGNALGIKNPNELYLGMLRSRTIADALINKFSLQKLYGESTVVDTREELWDRTALSSGRDGLIVIEVSDVDQQRAADLANAYTEQLEQLTSRLAVSEAGQRRLFFEKQLRQSREQLNVAESELRDTQEKTGLVQLDQQSKAMVEAVATLRAQIVAREVDLGAMKSYSTSRNPELVRTQDELAELRSQLKKLESEGAGPGSLILPTSKIPTLGLEYLRKYREVRYAEAMLETLAKQYELARIDEARDAAIIQVVDEALPQDKKSRPIRWAIIAISTIVAALAGLVWSFICEVGERFRTTRSTAAQWERLRRLLAVR